MRIGIYTNDLTRDNAHLMPWRTVTEVAAGMREAGHDVVVLSGRSEAGCETWHHGNVPIHEVAKSRSDEERRILLNQIHQEQLDALYWPFAWWGANKARALLAQLDVRIIGYIPGAAYMCQSVLCVIPSIGVRFSLPYLVQSLYPTKRLTSEMKRCGVESVITMTDFSRQELIRGGWPKSRIIAVAPGKSTVPKSDVKSPTFQRVMDSVGDRPFFLFFGPPTAIRGVNQLLAAFSRLTSKHDDVCLVCLFRADSNIDMPSFQQKIEGMGLGPRVQCVWDSVKTPELSAFIAACHAVVLPFLLVPSEIPLAIIEAAGHGKPVISTGPGGTGDFVEKFGLTAPVADVSELAAKMKALFYDRDLYKDRCRRAREVFASVKTWPEVAQLWMKVLDNQ